MLLIIERYRMFKSRRLLLWAAPLVAGVLVAGGCGRITLWQVRSNMTPELHDLARNHGHALNDQARYIDNNGRSAWNDLDRLLLLDHNSTLHPYPIP